MANAGDPPHARIAGARIDAVQVDGRRLQVEADAVVEGKPLPQAPGVLHEDRSLPLAIFYDRLESAVLPCGVVQNYVPGDGRDTAGKQRVKSASVALIGGVATGEVGGIEQRSTDWNARAQRKRHAWRELAVIGW